MGRGPGGVSSGLGSCASGLLAGRGRLEGSAESRCGCRVNALLPSWEGTGPRTLCGWHERQRAGGSEEAVSGPGEPRQPRRKDRGALTGPARPWKLPRVFSRLGPAVPHRDGPCATIGPVDVVGDSASTRTQCLRVSQGVARGGGVGAGRAFDTHDLAWGVRRGPSPLTPHPSLRSPGGGSAPTCSNAISRSDQPGRLWVVDPCLHAVRGRVCSHRVRH